MTRGPRVSRRVTSHERLLKRAVRRRRPVAFWHLARSRLVAATLRPSDDEPLLLTCAAISAEWHGASRAICPGLLELGLVVAAGVESHAAALDEQEAEDGGSGVRVEWADGSAGFSATVITEVVSGFARVGFRLAALRPAPWARGQLTRFLGAAVASPPADRRLADDPLAAVTVAPDCEAQAARLGPLLAVPIGMALACFGVLGRDAWT